MKLLPDTYKRLFALSGLAAFLWLVLGVQLYTNPGFNLLAAAGSFGTSSIVSTGDHSLSLTLDTTDGGIADIAAGSISLPLLAQRGGLSITEFNGKSLSTQYTVLYNGGSFTTPPTTGTTPVSVEETYTSGSNYLRVDASVGSNQDLPLTVTYTLPLNANGWKWHDTLRSSRAISAGGTYSYLSTDSGGAPVTTSVYPLGTISNGTTAITVAIPMNAPRLYTISYTPQGLVISFQVATSPAATKLGGKANVSLVLYESSGAQGVRGALAQYYSIFPQFFTDRIPPAEHGTWNRAGNYSLKYVGATPGVVTSGTPEVLWAKDYGYGMKNVVGAPSVTQTTWSDAAGTLSSVYRQDWVFNASASYSYGAAVAELQSTATNTDTSIQTLKAKAALIATAKNSTGGYDYEGVGYTDHVQFYENTEVPAWRSLMISQTNSTIAAIKSSTTGHPDALHMDSWSGIQRWNAAFDYVRTHWAYASLPLVPDFRPGQVGVTEMLAFPNYAYISRDFADIAHDAGLYVSANTNNPERRALGWLGNDVIDFFGIESSLATKGAMPGSTVDSYALWKRAIAYQRPVSTLETDFQTLPPANLRAVLNQNLFYDIYASGDPQNSSDGNSVPAMWTTTSRAIFKQYTPIFKKLSAAGWEPVTYAVSNNAAVYLERYGSLATEDMYLAVRNETDGPQTATVTLQPQPGAVSGQPYLLHDLLGLSPDLTSTVQLGSNTVTMTVPARTTLIFTVGEVKVIPPPDPVLSITATPLTVAYNGTTTIQWSSKNTTFCTVTGSVPGIPFPRVGISGSATAALRNSGATITYTLACDGLADIGTTTKTVAVVVGSAPDLTRPLVALTSPTSLMSPLHGTIVISASSTDAGGISRLRFQVDGISVGPLDVTPPYQINWDSTTVPDGSHTFTATAWDTSGNARITGARVVRVLNDATSTATLIGLPTCRLLASSTQIVNTTFPISWSASNTPETAVLKLGTTVVRSGLALPTGATTVTAPSTPGVYTYVLVLTTAKGLIAACGRDVYVVPAPPQITVPLAIPTASPAPGTYNDSVTVTLRAQTGASIHYSLDTTAPTCSTGRTYSGPIVLNATTVIKALACPGVQAGGGLLQRISGFFQSLVAAVVVAVTGGTTYTSSSVATFTYTVIQPTGTNAYNPRGYIDLPNQAGQSCEVGGWVCDPDNLSQNVYVDFYEGSTKLGSMQTNFERVPKADIAAACGAAQNADGTFTKGYTPAKGFRAILSLPVGSHWVEARARSIDSLGKETGDQIGMAHGASYSSPVVCNPATMTGTLPYTTVVK